MEYYGVYKGDKNWAWRKAIYNDDVTALNGMRTLALKKMITNEDGELKEKMVRYELDYLVEERGARKRVIYNG